MNNTEQPFYIDYRVQEVYNEEGDSFWVNDAVIVLNLSALSQSTLEHISEKFPGAFDYPSHYDGQVNQNISYHRDWEFDLTPDTLQELLTATTTPNNDSL